MADPTQDEFDLGPPPEEEFVLDLTPISLQGSAAAKALIREAVRAQTELCQRFFIREVEVRIEWFLHESRRWGTPSVLSSPDLDNIIKPLIDGLCGPRGILIDDCQVQSLSCSWLDWHARDEQRLVIAVRTLMADDWIPRGRLVGVEATDGVCWPLLDDQPPEVLAFVVEHLVENRDSYAKLLAMGVPDDDARYVLSLAPVFHRSHFERHGFQVAAAADYLAQLATRAGGE